MLGVAGVVALYHAISRQALRDMLSLRVILLAAIGIGWLCIASFISENPERGGRKILQICLLAGLFFPLAWYLRTIADDLRRQVLRAMAYGVLLALVLLIAGYLAIAVFDQQVFAIERENKLTVLYPGLIVVALLFPGLFGYLRQAKQPVLLWGAVAVAAGLSFAIGSMIAMVLIAFSVISFLLFHRDPWHLPRILALSLVVLTITLPVSMPLVLDRIAVVFVEDLASDTTGRSGSIEHRYRIWRFAADRAAERPFFGWGFNTSRELPGGHTLMAEGAELLPLHPHNAVLQVWLELGVPGLLLLCILLWRTYMPPGWQSFARRELLIRTQTVTLIFIAASVTFGIWQSWWLAVIALVMASLSLWHEGEIQ